MFRRYRRNVISGLVVAVVAAFDTRRVEAFVLTKYTLLVGGVLLLFVLAAVSWTRTRQLPLWRSGLQWPLVALATWALVATVTSGSPGLSLHGSSPLRDGLLANLAFLAVPVLVVDAFDLRHVKQAAAVLWYGAGGIAIGYGALQLHDALTSVGGEWDFLTDSSKGANWVASTLGNPNHLAGLIAMLVPLGVALLCTRQPWWARAVSVALLLVGVAELLYTTTRGAWLAALVSLTLLSVLLARELWARRRAALAFGGAGVASVAILVLTLSTPVAVTEQFASIFDPQAHTRVERTEVWRAAWRMGVDRPLVGHGLDMVESRYNRYQTARFVHEDGPEVLVNGAHNTFFNYLANQGFPGLAFFTTLVIVAALRGAGALRRLRRLARTARKDEHRAPLLEARILLAGVLASGLAYLVQASFNTQMLPLTLVFWVLVGLVAVAAVATGVPDTWRPRALLAVPDADADATASAAAPSMAPERAERHAGLAVTGPPDGVTVAVGVGVALIAVLIGWWASGPYRAQALSREAATHAAAAARSRQDGQADAAAAASDRAVELYRRVTSLDPWNPIYRSDFGKLLLGMGKAQLAREDASSGARAAALFEEARHQYRRAAEVGKAFTDEMVYGAALTEIAKQPVGLGNRLLPLALAASREALEANPWSPRAAMQLADVHEARGETTRALAVLQESLRIQVRDRDKVPLLVALGELYEKNGMPARARAAWREVLEIDPRHKGAKDALAETQAP